VEKREDMKKRIDDLMIKSTDENYLIFNKGRKYLRPRFMVGKTGSYYGWSGYIEKELKRLTDDWLEGDYAGVSLPELVKRYQAGEVACFDIIKGRLYGEIDYILREHGRGVRHAVFTRLDGESAKSPRRGRTVVMKPGDDEYDEDEEQQIYAIYEENFTKSDRQQLIKYSLQDALNTYIPNKSGFKTWFKIKFNDDVTDLHGVYKKGWMNKPQSITLQRYEEMHKKDRTWDFSEFYEKLPKGFLDRLDDDHKRLLNIKVRAVNYKLNKKTEAALMGIKKDKYKKLQQELEQEYIDWLEQNQNQKKKHKNKDKIGPRNYFNISDPTPYQADNK
jgi:hypothetical protein